MVESVQLSFTLMQYDPQARLSNSPVVLHCKSESLSLYKQNCGAVKFVCSAMAAENPLQFLPQTCTQEATEGMGLLLEKQSGAVVSAQEMARIQ